MAGKTAQVEVLCAGRIPVIASMPSLLTRSLFTSGSCFFNLFHDGIILLISPKNYE